MSTQVDAGGTDISARRCCSGVWRGTSMPCMRLISAWNAMPISCFPLTRYVAPEVVALSRAVLPEHPIGFRSIRPRVQYLFHTPILVSHGWTNKSRPAAECLRPTDGILPKHHCELRQISPIHTSVLPRGSNGLAFSVQNVR